MGFSWRVDTDGGFLWYFYDFILVLQNNCPVASIIIQLALHEGKWYTGWDIVEWQSALFSEFLR